MNIMVVEKILLIGVLMKPKSHTLFHFTKNIDVLKNILYNGFWPRYCLEDASWYSGPQSEYQLAFPMVCFCDIPLSRLDEHVGFYGDYGVGVTKSWALANDLCPVMYLAKTSQVSNAIRRITTGNFRTENYDGSAGDINSLISNIKPIEGRMLVNGNLLVKEFYQESEWRYVIKNLIDDRSESRVWLTENEFLNEEFRESENLKTKQNHSLKISPSDIKYIFVKSESDIPNIVNFIQNDLDHLPASDLKILLSKIISIETIREDI
jgi:hypothetical protein